LVFWPWLLYQRSPELFGEWLWVNNFGRFTGRTQLGPELDHWMYVRILPVFGLPAFPLAALALWHARQGGLRALARPPIAIPLVFLLVILITLSASSSSRNIYLLPGLVPLSVLAAARIDMFAGRFSHAVGTSCLWTAGLLSAVLWVTWAAFLLGWPPALATRLSERHPGFMPELQWPAFTIALLLTFGWMFAVRRPLNGALRMPFAWAASLTLVWGLSMTLWLPYLNHAKSYRGVVAALRQALPNEMSCVAAEGLRESHRAMLHYFGDIRTVPSDSQEAGRCNVLLVEAGGISQPAHAASWVALWNGSRPGDAAERFWLFAKTPALHEGPGIEASP
jgi:4-amino-4-deoxy-L-arabinose transferase-like glycosyltransferase